MQEGICINNVNQGIGSIVVKYQHESCVEHRRRFTVGFRIHMVPARDQRAAGKFHDRPDPMGRLWRNRGRSRGRVVVRGKSEKARRKELEI